MRGSTSASPLGLGAHSSGLLKVGELIGCSSPCWQAPVTARQKQQINLKKKKRISEHKQSIKDGEQKTNGHL